MDDELGYQPEDPDFDRSPICTSCGVSCLPPESPGGESLCENPDCPAFGEAVDSGDR